MKSQYFNLTIDCDNAAFEDYGATEVVRVLLSAVDAINSRDLPPVRMDEYANELALKDINGNTVGHAGFYAR